MNCHMDKSDDKKLKSGSGFGAAHSRHDLNISLFL